MDITIEREKVFRDRTDIDEFDVIDLCKLDAQMLKRIENSQIVHFEDADKYILSCFNNAYYIAILILNDKHPVHHVKRYIEIAESAAPHVDDNGYALYEYRYIDCMTMAMVFNYLRACDQDLYGVKERSPLLKAIRDYHTESHNFEPPVHNAPVLFFDNILSPESVTENMVNKELFYPKFPLEETPAEVVIKQQNEKIKELENEIEFLSTDIPTVDVGDKSQRAYIARLLIEKMKNVRQNDRTQWAIVMSAITGASPSTCRNMFSTEPNMDTIKDDDKKKINNAFNKLEIDITI